MSVENLIRTSTENYLSSFIASRISTVKNSKECIVSYHDTYVVALVLTSIETSIRTSTENSSPSFIANRTSTVKNSKECIFSYIIINTNLLLS